MLYFCCCNYTQNQIVMKFIISLFLLVLSFSSFANNGVVTEEKQSFSIEASVDANPGRKKKARKGKRTNKKRKRKCAKWGRRGFAG